MANSELRWLTLISRYCCLRRTTTGQDPVMMKNVDDMIVSANRKFGVTSIVISLTFLIVSNRRSNHHDQGR